MASPRQQGKLVKDHVHKVKKRISDKKFISKKRLMSQISTQTTLSQMSPV